MDHDPDDSDYWYPNNHSEIKYIELSDTKKYEEFGQSLITTHPLAERITKEELECEFTEEISWYRRATLTSGFLEYIDNDPDGTLNDGLPMFFIHGFVGNIFDFKPYLQYFKDKVRGVSISILGQEKYFEKPQDLNSISVMNFTLLIKELAHQLGFERIVLVGHSFGGIIIQAITYYHPELVAGASQNCMSPIAPHLGFLAYTATSYGVIAENYDNDWKYVRKMINDKKFQAQFKYDALKSTKEFYLDEKVVDGKSIQFHYEIPEDPYEAMVAFAYNRTYLKSVFGVGYLPSIHPTLKMFTFGDIDFVADFDRVTQGIYKITKGEYRVTDPKQFLHINAWFEYKNITQDSEFRIFDAKGRSCDSEFLDNSLGFKCRLKEVSSNENYIPSQQIAHGHGFKGERHNVHKNRYKFMIQALHEYYKDIVTIEHIKYTKRQYILDKVKQMNNRRAKI